MIDLPLILVVVHKPALREAIQHHAETADFRIHWTLNLDAAGDDQAEVVQVAELRPALIVAELDQPADWLPKVHSDPATRRIPVIAIADDDAARLRARLSRIDTVLSATEFIDALPDIVTDNVRIFNQSAALRNQCDGIPSPLVLKGLREFNAREFFEAHETLEEAWKEEPGPIRELYRAILQVGIAYYQIQRKNYTGARKLFLRTLQWFAPLPDYCLGIDVAQLRADALTARTHLEALGPEHIAEFDQTLFKPVRYEGDRSQ